MTKQLLACGVAQRGYTELARRLAENGLATPTADAQPRLVVERTEQGWLYWLALTYVHAEGTAQKMVPVGQVDDSQSRWLPEPPFVQADLERVVAIAEEALAGGLRLDLDRPS